MQGRDKKDFVYYYGDYCPVGRHWDRHITHHFSSHSDTSVSDLYADLSTENIFECEETDEDSNNNNDVEKGYIKDETEPLSSLKKRLRRKVSFADAVGLDLASIRVMTEGRDTPPYLENYLSALHIQEPACQLVPHFVQPITNFSEYMAKLNEGRVSLESVDIKNNILTGVVKVRNIAYHKNVVVHYTVDSWRSKHTLPCYYVNPITGAKAHSVHDAFSFQLEMADIWNNVEFCVSFVCQSQTYWDNNGGANYLLVREKAE